MCRCTPWHRRRHWAWLVMAVVGCAARAPGPTRLLACMAATHTAHCRCTACIPNACTVGGRFAGTPTPAIPTPPLPSHPTPPHPLACLPACLPGCPAADTLIPILTVYEMLLYTAEMKRSLHEPLEAKKQVGGGGGGARGRGFGGVVVVCVCGGGGV